MDGTTRLSIELPQDLADAVRARVASGSYATEAEVVAEDLALLAEQEEPLDKAVEAKLSEGYDVWQAIRPTWSVSTMRRRASNGKARDGIDRREALSSYGQRRRAATAFPLEQWIEGEASVAVARRYRAAILVRCRKLERYALRGTPRDDLRPGLRTILFRRRVTIGYVVEQANVVIVAVVGRGRDIQEALTAAESS